eukprot:jgi/Psemu1/243105/estExt_Genewise1.C_3340011
MSTILRKSVKHGIGRLTASAERMLEQGTKQKPAVTRLTQVAHKAPTRLIPVKKSSVQMKGAAVCALSNYGAGMLQGDSSELSVHVEKSARLALISQGASRIYTQRVPGEVKARMDVRVGKNGVFVFTPDPCVMFASSSYSQTQEFEIHPESSVALIDWFSSGRFKNQERWVFDKLSTRTSLKWMNDTETETDVVPEKVRSSQTNDHDMHGVADSNCFASLIIYGKEMAAVKDKCQFLSDSFAAQHTRIRKRDQHDEDNTELQSVKNIGELNLCGRVFMGLSKVSLPGKPSDAYVIRLAGTTNEDIYRVFHECLTPLAPSFGYEFYKERILARRSEIPTQDPVEAVQKIAKRTRTLYQTTDQSKNDPFSEASLDSNFKSSRTSASFWSLVMLADSGLPTGSFAHSAGLEAAAQLGMIRGEDDVRRFIHAATRSSLQLLVPFLIAGHRIAQGGEINENGTDNYTTKNNWEKLHRQCQAIMVTNEPACSASIDQGKSLVRVATNWFKGAKASSNYEDENDVLECLRSGSTPHIAPAFGVICGLLGLDEVQACRLFAYCTARDLVSSAVRLSLVGPLASVPMLDSVQESAEDTIRNAYREIQKNPKDPLLTAASSAPVIEAVHPCHEILQVRLFRS